MKLRAEAALQELNAALEGRVRARTAKIAHQERFLTAVLETMQDALFVNRDNRIVFLNSACLHLFAATDRDQLLGRSPLDLFDPAHHEALTERIRTLIVEGKPVPPMEGQIVRLDGRVADVEVTASPIVDDQVPVILVLRDLTTRKALEQQLRQAQKMEAVGQLTGGIAHDFNNLLSVVVGNLEMMLDRASVRDDPDLADWAQAAMDGALRGAELTQRLLAFARKQPLQPQVVGLNERLPGVVALLRRTLGENVTIAAVPEPGLWRALVDPAQLENAIVNLAINARDAMPGGGAVTIEMANAHLDTTYAAQQAEVTPGEYVMLAVTDTGTGMAPEVVERAFDPFFTTKQPGQGTGLGLSMVHGFVKQSRGHIKIYSEPGHGTTVRIYLPRAETGSPAAIVPVRAAEPLPSGSETILLVEDNPGVRRTALRLLTHLGYRVLEAEHAAAALAILAEDETIDLLLSDIVMPGGMDGYALAEAGRRRRPTLKVLLTSGYAAAALERNGQARAVPCPVLSKPYRAQDLARMVRQVLDRPD